MRKIVELNTAEIQDVVGGVASVVVASQHQAPPIVIPSGSVVVSGQSQAPMPKPTPAPSSRAPHA